LQKIVFVLGNYKNGGMAMRATNLANEFAERGYAVDILVTGEMSDKPFFSQHKNVEIVVLDEFIRDCPLSKRYTDRDSEICKLKRYRYFTKWTSSIDKKLERRINFLRAGEKLRPYFVNNPNTAVIAFGASYIKVALSASEKLNCKVIYAEKNAPELECPKESPGFENMVSLLKQANSVIVQTQDAKEYYSAYLDNVCVINNPIKAGLPKPFIGKRDKRIVSFCRISEQKNLELLMDAFQMLHRDYPEYSVEIYGNIVYKSEQAYKERLIQRAEKMRISDCFRFLPPAADVHKKVMDAAMFVSSSDYEGLSNSMIEAMAIGLPCVCTDCLGGGTREVMVDRENGLIVPMKNAEALYQAMKELIENSALAEKCACNAAKIRDKLDVKKIATQWLEIIETA